MFLLAHQPGEIDTKLCMLQELSVKGAIYSDEILYYEQFLMRLSVSVSVNPFKDFAHINKPMLI